MPASSASRLSPRLKKSQLKAEETDALLLKHVQPDEFLVGELALALGPLERDRLPGSGRRVGGRGQRNEHVADDAVVADLGHLDHAAVDLDEDARHARVELLCRSARVVAILEIRRLGPDGRDLVVDARLVRIDLGDLAFQPADRLRRVDLGGGEFAPRGRFAGRRWRREASCSARPRREDRAHRR